MLKGKLYLEKDSLMKAMGNVHWKMLQKQLKEEKKMNVLLDIL